MATAASGLKESEAHEGKHGTAEHKAVALGNEILRVRAGSVVYGTSTGASDSDEVGVCIPPPAYVAGTRTISNEPFEQYEHHTAWERPGGLRNRSMPGDTDLVIYSARKFLCLAMNGNPSAIEKFFTPAEHVITQSLLGLQLRELYPHVISKEAGPHYLGYLDRQRLSLLSHEGKGCDVTRPELVEQFGYDVKFAAHMVRVGFMGVDLLYSGRLLLPMPLAQREYLVAIRTGKVPMAEALRVAGNLEDEIEVLMARDYIREHPDRDYVDTWLVQAHQHHWHQHRLI